MWCIIPLLQLGWSLLALVPSPTFDLQPQIDKHACACTESLLSIVWSAINHLRCPHHIQKNTKIVFEWILFWAKSVHLLNAVQMYPTKTRFLSPYTRYPEHKTSTQNRLEQTTLMFHSPVWMHLYWDLLLWCTTPVPDISGKLNPADFLNLEVR